MKLSIPSPLKQTRTREESNALSADLVVHDIQPLSVSVFVWIAVLGNTSAKPVNDRVRNGLVIDWRLLLFRPHREFPRQNVVGPVHHEKTSEAVLALETVTAIALA
jgi:hypothetical protein